MKITFFLSAFCTLIFISLEMWEIISCRIHFSLPKFIVECSSYTMKKCCPSVRNIFAKLLVIREVNWAVCVLTRFSHSAYAWACASRHYARTLVPTLCSSPRLTALHSACVILLTFISCVYGFVLQMSCWHVDSALSEGLSRSHHVSSLSETVTTHFPGPLLVSPVFPSLSPLSIFLPPVVTGRAYALPSDNLGSNHASAPAVWLSASESYLLEPVFSSVQWHSAVPYQRSSDRRSAKPLSGLTTC